MLSAKGGSSRRLTTTRLPREMSVFFLVLAFLLQGYVAQTHIHGKPGPVTAPLSHFANGVPQRAPAQNDEANCPFCQAVVHAGTFFAPPAHVLPSPVPAFLYFVARPHVTAAVSWLAVYGWHQRAPPNI